MMKQRDFSYVKYKFMEIKIQLKKYLDRCGQN